VTLTYNLTTPKSSGALNWPLDNVSTQLNKLRFIPSQVIDHTRILHISVTTTLTFDLITSKSMGVIYWHGQYIPSIFNKLWLTTFQVIDQIMIIGRTEERTKSFKYLKWWDNK
jgi:hypothetical protein